MPNVTIQVPRETYRKARIWCAENDSNISRAVRQILEIMPRLSARKLEQVRSSTSATPGGSAIQSTPASAPQSPATAAPALRPLAGPPPAPVPQKSRNPSRTAKLENCKSAKTGYKRKRSKKL